MTQTTADSMNQPILCMHAILYYMTNSIQKKELNAYKFTKISVLAQWAFELQCPSVPL